MTLPNRGGDSAPDARNPVGFLDLDWSNRNKKHKDVPSI